MENDLLILRDEYDTLPAFRVASGLLRLKLTFYEQGNKSGTLLAWQIKQLQTKTSVTTIISNGHVVGDPIEINDAFRSYFKDFMIQQIN